MQNELLSEGLTLMLAGMGTVFVFLTALVIAMTVMSKLVRSLQPGSVAAEAAPTDNTAPTDNAAPTDNTAPTDNDEIAAIAAAIAEHRRK